VKRAFVVLSLAALVTVASTRTAAAATERAEEDPLPRWAEHDWRIAVGVGLPGFVVGAGAGPGVGVLSPGVALTAGSIFLERRIVRPLWLLVGGSISYARSELEGPGGPLESRAIAGRGALGARFAITPDEPFELSTFATVGALGAQSKSEPQGAGEQIGVDGNLGLALDRELIDGLGLRLSVVVGQIAWSRVRTTFVLAPGNVQTNESDHVAGGLALLPTLELRFSF
jgi:hypothetical protein